MAGAVSWVAVVAIRRFALTLAADPWPNEVDDVVKSKAAVPVCLNCLHPQDEGRWFCPQCDFPAGEFVTLMPYLQNFALGEVFRRGVYGREETGVIGTLSLLVASLGEYGALAPVYWFWMVRKAFGRPICESRRIDIRLDPGVPPLD